jgi:hypothetical protein
MDRHRALLCMICNLTQADIGGRFGFMSESLLQFWKSNPIWAIIIVVFTVLPIIGAVVHILLKAFGRKGLDNTMPQPPDEIPEDKTDGIPDDESSSKSNHDK